MFIKMLSEIVFTYVYGIHHRKTSVCIQSLLRSICLSLDFKLGGCFLTLVVLKRYCDFVDNRFLLLLLML